MLEQHAEKDDPSAAVLYGTSSSQVPQTKAFIRALVITSLLKEAQEV